jgi:hypothetical protein
MQPLVKRCANREDTTARTLPRFEDDDRHPGLVKKISSAQTGETGADDHNGVGIERTRGGAANGRRGERKPTRREMKKCSAIQWVALAFSAATPITMSTA